MPTKAKKGLRMKELQEKIDECTYCQKDAILKDKVSYSKPKIFYLNELPTVMIIGHSPSVRSSEKAEYVLKMDKTKQHLYKYITKEILSPLQIDINHIYCTNLLKCETYEMPKEMKTKKIFFESAANNCIHLLEQEIYKIQPELIISLSESVLKVLSNKYLGKTLEMKTTFGKILSLKIKNRYYHYIPLVHITRKNTSTHKYYFPKQYEKLKVLGNLIQHKKFLKECYNKLIKFEDIRFNDNIHRKLPEKPGVYVISLVENSEYLYIGRTNNLKRRLYTNHLMGSLANARLKKYLINSKVCKNIDKAKEYIFNKCQCSFIIVDDYKERGMIEGYFTGVLKPRFGIDEEH